MHHNIHCKLKLNYICNFILEVLTRRIVKLTPVCYWPDLHLQLFLVLGYIQWRCLYTIHITVNASSRVYPVQSGTHYLVVYRHKVCMLIIIPHSGPRKARSSYKIFAKNWLQRNLIPLDARLLQVFALQLNPWAFSAECWNNLVVIIFCGSIHLSFPRTRLCNLGVKKGIWWSVWGFVRQPTTVKYFCNSYASMVLKNKLRHLQRTERRATNKILSDFV